MTSVPARRAARPTPSSLRVAPGPDRLRPAPTPERVPPRRGPGPAPVTLRPSTEQRVRPQPRATPGPLRSSEINRRQLGRRVATWTGVVAVAALFGLAAAHAVLVADAARLDQLEAEVDRQSVRYADDRLDVARLESPERVVREAQDRFGMVLPERIVYLTPSTPPPAATAPTPSPGGAGDRAGEPWTTIKPFLGR